MMKQEWKGAMSRSYGGVYAVWKIALMMEAVSASETSVNFYQIKRRNVQKTSHI
jgi:hypothetical protein